MAGIYKPEFIPPASAWESNQGSFIAFFSVSAFMDTDEFRTEMDRYVGAVRGLEPFPGFDRAELPGGLEWERESTYGRDGIPVGDDHRERLEEVAAQVGVDSPFQQYEHTRFGEE